MRRNRRQVLTQEQKARPPGYRTPWPLCAWGVAQGFLWSSVDITVDLVEGFSVKDVLLIRQISPFHVRVGSAGFWILDIIQNIKKKTIIQTKISNVVQCTYIANIKTDFYTSYFLNLYHMKFTSTVFFMTLKIYILTLNLLQVPLPRYGMESPVRVCNRCYIYYM